jgi:hypothetical protein
VIDLLLQQTLYIRGAWLKTGTDGKRSSFVRLSGAPSIQTTTARGRTDFSIGLKQQTLLSIHGMIRSHLATTLLKFQQETEYQEQQELKQ